MLDPRSATGLAALSYPAPHGLLSRPTGCGDRVEGSFWPEGVGFMRDLGCGLWGLVLPRAAVKRGAVLDEPLASRRAPRPLRPARRTSIPAPHQMYPNTGGKAITTIAAHTA